MAAKVVPDFKGLTFLSRGAVEPEWLAHMQSVMAAVLAWSWLVDNDTFVVGTGLREI